MLFALVWQLPHIAGRVQQFVQCTVNKIELRKIGLLALAVPLVLPMNVVSAEGDEAQAVHSLDTTISLSASYDENIVAPNSITIQFELVESAYQARLKEEAAKKRAAQTRVIAVSHATADPGLAVKREWARRAAAAYGIDWKVLEAVWQVESGKRWYSAVRSYAGAQGPCQFMPGTWRAYAQDGNGDGVKDVNDARDCLFASAKLLAVNGAASGDYVRALLRYNNSMSYVHKVLRIANSIEG